MMRNFFFAFLSLTLPFLADCSPLVKRCSDSTTVKLDRCSGEPMLYSQGLLYGLSGGNVPPQQYVDELGINYMSDGGAQMDSQPAGYANSMSSYDLRFSSAKAVWQRAREVNGVFIIKGADLYGADERTLPNFSWPGDNGNWTLWDNFVQQLISDLKSNGMTQPAYMTQIDIWNEPDINFGGRPQEQYNEMFVRAAKALRAAGLGEGAPDFSPLIGPSTAVNPDGGNGFWDSFLAYIQSNGGQQVQPDVWNWHMEMGGNNDPIPPAQYLPNYLSRYGLTTGIGFQNNEFGVRAQQVPSYSAWFKARYERLQFHAMRGNWANGAELKDLMAQLLIKNPDGSYDPTGEYQVYKYYKQMTGAPCATLTGSSVDSFAVSNSSQVSALLGSQFFTGTATLTFDKISSAFGDAEEITVKQINIPYNNGGSSYDRNVYNTYNIQPDGDSITVTFDIQNSEDAWAAELSVAQ